MTRPGVPDGEIRGDIRINADNAADDIRRGLERAGRETDRDTDRLGRELGEEIGEAMRLEFEEFARSLTEVLGTVLDRFDADAGRNRNAGRNAGRRVGRNLAEGAGETITTGLTGIFQRFAQTVGPVIGSIFNVGGRSPYLLAILIPILGTIIALVIAAVHGFQALIALLSAVPGLIFAIGLQGTALLFIFNGIFEAAALAFSAKNPQELEAALKNLNPAAADFIRTLLPLRDLFKQISDLAQTNFFTALGDVFTRIRVALGDDLLFAISKISGALGSMLNELLGFFATSGFQDFLRGITQSTVMWLDTFGPALRTFLWGLTNFGEALLPFLDKFGQGFNQLIANIGGWLDDLSVDPEFLAWLDDAWATLKALMPLLGALYNLAKAIGKSIAEAGGDEFLMQLTVLIDMLVGLFEHELGVRAMEGLLRILISLVFWFDVFVTILLIIGALFWGMTEAVDIALHAVAGFFSGLEEDVDGLRERVVSFLQSLAGLFIGQFHQIIANLKTFITVTVPDEIEAAAKDFVNVLYQAGRNLVQGLINGARSMFGPFAGVMDWLAKQAADHFPSSPAKVGPLSGSGDPFNKGAEIVNRLAAGITMAAPELSAASSRAAGDIFFGPESIQVGFNGAVPTQSQALMTGQQVGSGISQQLVRREIRTL